MDEETQPEAGRNAEETGALPPEVGEKPAKRPQGRSAKSLGLDVEAAQAGKTWLLLPWGVRNEVGGAKGYPLPSEYGEIALVAGIKIKPGERNSGSEYIRKCRRAVKRRAVNTRLVDFQVRRQEVAEISRQTATAGKQAIEDMRLETEKVRLEAAKTLTSMGDLNGLAKGAAREILEAFKTGEPLHGQPVTVNAAIDTIGKVFTHVARLGGGALDGDGKEQAEDEVIREFNEATRARLRKEVAS